MPRCSGSSGCTWCTCCTCPSRDIHRGVPIDLEVPDLFDKVVARHRGGYCYELNGLFASLLAALGHDVELVSSRTWMPGGELSPPFDHLALLVDVGDDRYLVDVGFGDAFRQPQPLGSTWTEPRRRLRTVATPDGWQLEKDEGDGWVPTYLLDPTPRELSEFLPRSRWHEASPDSPFRHRRLATRATPTGRVTVTDDQLVVTSPGTRSEQPLPDRSARRTALRSHFSPAVVDAFEQALP